MGELLNIISELELSITPKTIYSAIDPAIDDLIDETKFTQAKHLVNNHSLVAAVPVKFPNPATIDNMHSESIEVSISETDLKHILAKCRQKQSTLTNALSAAFALGVYEVVDKNNQFNLTMGLNLRKYAKKEIPVNTLANYSHAVRYVLDINENQNFWDLSLAAQTKLEQIISQYKLPKYSDAPILMADIQANLPQKVKNQEFLFSYLMSNVGIIDNAFERTQHSYPIKSYYYTVKYDPLRPLAIYIVSLNNQLYLNYTYSAPAFNQDMVQKITNIMIDYLTNT